MARRITHHGQIALQNNGLYGTRLQTQSEHHGHAA